MSGFLAVGDEGTGTLAVTNGGTVSNTGNGYIGLFADSSGTANVNGTGSTWTNTGGLFVGGDDMAAAGTGLLQISNGGTVSAATTTIWNTGTLEIGASYTLTTGTLTFAGGTLRTLAATTFSNDATLVAGGVNNEGIVVNSNGFTSTLSGVLSGSAGLTKAGTGTIILTNTNTYIGDTNINAGSLIIDGSIASMNTNINSVSALLGGTGTIGGNVVNGGIVSPGDSPGTLHINGNYTQQSPGTLRMEIGGLGAGQHDLLTMGGNASLNGTLQLVQLNNFQPVLGDQLTILTATGGVTGTFSTVTGSFGVMLRPEAIYEANDVLIEFVLGSFNIGGLTTNQAAIANNLDAAMADMRAADLIDFLNAEPMANLPHDYDLIAPEEFASIYEIGFSHATVQMLNLERRMDDIRAGSTGFSSDGLSMSLRGVTPRNIQVRPTGEFLADNAPSPVMRSAPENRWGVFVTGNGEFVNVNDHDSNAPGYDITTGGFTLGADYRIAPTFAVGLDGGYAHNWADLVNDGRVTVDSGKVGIYATWFPAELYVTGGFNAGWNNYDSRRAALSGDATGSTDGYDLDAFLGAGYDWKVNGWTLGPVGTIQYTYINFNSFTESGSLAPLDFPDQDEDSFRSTVGGRIAYDWHYGSMIVRPEVRGAWQHDYSDRAYPIDSQLASGAGGVFTVWGPHVGRDAALVSGSVTVQLNDRVSTYVGYDGVFGRSNYDSHNVSGGVRISF